MDRKTLRDVRYATDLGIEVMLGTIGQNVGNGNGDGLS
jgi:hypothetical protein